MILSLVAQVANNYLTLRALDEQLQVAKKTLGTYNESLKLFELQFKYGIVSQMNVAQAKSQSQTAAAQIPAIEQQIVNTENALCVLLGRNPGRIARGKAVVDMKAPQTPEELPSQLLERRPDVVQAEQQLIAANAQIGAAKALYFPTISLTGALGSVSGDLSSLFTGPTRVWSYGGSLLGPDLHRRRGDRAGQPGRGRAAGGALQLREDGAGRIRRRRECADRAAEDPAEAGRAAGPGRRAQRLHATGATAVRRRLSCRTRRYCRPNSSCFRRS